MEINKEKYEKELDFWRKSNYDYITKNTKIKEEIASLIQTNMKLKDRVEQLQDKLDNTKLELQEANESITWWSNRYKVIEEEHKNCTRKHWQEKCAEHCANEKIFQRNV